MATLHPSFSQISSPYFFPEMEKRIATLRKEQPNISLIDLGVGDVTHPLPPTLAASLYQAAQEMGDPTAFQGYGPENGYSFLRQAIAEHAYVGLDISPEEIFISNGAKCDLAHFQELFSQDNRVGIPDPTYPVYADISRMAGRSISFIPTTEADGFLPLPPSIKCDLIYLCSPNNPTGIALTRELLARWIAKARRDRAILFFDGAYEAFIRSPDCPRSIYEIEGAKEVAVEIRSFSKNAGFTGLRCSYTVVPKELSVDSLSLHALWTSRQNAKFGGVPYPVQRCAASIYTPQGQQEVGALVRTYSDQASLLLQGLKQLGFRVYGGENAPYVWCRVPPGLSSWDYFSLLLEKAHLVALPGSGFGAEGEGYVRFSAFAHAPRIEEGLQRLRRL